MGVVTLWKPLYWLDGSIKAATALVSVATAILLGPMVPRILALPSPTQLRQVNQKLQTEITERIRVEAHLRDARDHLEVRVRERTAELEAEIAERKRTEAALRRSERRLTLALQASRMGTWEMDLTSRQLQWDGYARAILERNGESDLPGGFQIIHPEDRPHLLQTLDEAASSEEPLALECRLAGEGEQRWVSLHGAVESPPPGRLIGLVQDITARKQAEESRRRFEAQVQDAQKLESLGVLAGGIAHDFNNLLVGIIGNVDLAMMELSQESPARATIQAIQETALRAAELTRQLLAYSGRGRFVVEPLNLSRLVSEMAHLLRLSISKKAAVRYDLDENIPAIEADSTQLRQVLMNLIINASEALGDKPGAISVRTSALQADRAWLEDSFGAPGLPEGTYAFLEVSDTGCGMDEATRSRMYDPFFTTKFAGRGLGLAAVLGIVRGHKGAIRVDSEPDRGTTFQILFPCLSSGLESPHSAAAGNQASAWRGAGVVLIADDEPSVLAVAREILERAGFQVVTASDGVAALEQLQSHPEIAFALLDITMPGLSGAEVFREIRRQWPDTRVILSSGYSEEDAMSGIGKSAAFLQKPYRAAELIETVRRLLGA